MQCVMCDCELDHGPEICTYCYKKIIGTIDKVRVRSIDYSIVININTWVLSQNCIYVREHPCSQEIHVKIFRENRMSRYSMGIK